MPRIADIPIRTKLITLLMGVSVGVLSVACAAFVAYDRQSYSEAKGRTLGVLTDTMGQTLAGPVAFQDPTSAGLVIGNLAAEPTAERAGIYLPDGARLAEWTREGRSTTEKLADMQPKPGELIVSRPIGPADAQVGTLWVAYSTADVDERTLQFLQIAGAVLFGSIIVAFGLARKTQTLISAPVDRLAAAAQKVEQFGDYGVRVGIDAQDELGKLAATFDKMLAGIEARDKELEAHREGLERLVAQRTAALDARNAEMRLVMDNVDQGFVTIDPTTRMSNERSAAFDRWFGTPAGGEAAEAFLAEHLGKSDARFGMDFPLAWSNVEDGFLPLELSLDQLPREMKANGRHFTLDYKPILNGENLERLLVVVSDVTAEVERRANEERQREAMAVFEALMKDRDGLFEFFQDGLGRMERIRAYTDLTEPLLKRELHTLKGNASFFRLTSVVAACHHFEELLAEPDPDTIVPAREALDQAWNALSERLAGLSTDRKTGVELTPGEVAQLRRAILDGAAPSTILDQIRRWSHEHANKRVERLADQAAALGQRLGKPIQVKTSTGEVRLPAHRWGPLWSQLGHLVRNAVDHGIEDSDTRLSKGKSAEGNVHICVTVEEQPLPPIEGIPRLGRIETTGGPWLRIELSDDGGGIDWPRLRQAAQKKGWDCETEEELLEAMFSDGVTTREQATEVSGRGVGTAAVKEAIQNLGGTIEVLTYSGRGTTITLRAPIDDPEEAATMAI